MTGVEIGMVWGRMLAAHDQILKLHDRQIVLLERIDHRLAQMAEKSSGKRREAEKGQGWAEKMLNIRSTAYALLPIAIIALILAGKLTLLEGMGIIRQMILGPAGGQ
jgi:hypothetical protein